MTALTAGHIAAIAAAGGIGAATRFVVDGLIRARWLGAFPAATMSINVSGSLAIGLLSGAALFHGLGPGWFLVMATGFCGGYTTFSTTMAETVRLVQGEAWRSAVANALGTLGLCVAAAAAGVGVMGLTAS